MIGGVERKLHYIAISLPHSDTFFMKAYPAKTTEAFCDGHNAAFAFFGGVPLSALYDNTTIAVAKICGGGKRVRTTTFSELQSHYLFEAGSFAKSRYFVYICDMETNLFKFMALRAPDTAALEAHAETVVRDKRPFLETPLGEILARNNPPMTEAAVLQETQKFVAENHFAIKKGEPLLEKLGSFFARHRQAFEDGSFPADLKALLGFKPAAFVKSKKFASLVNQSWDKLYAFFILKRVDPLNLEGPLTDLRVLNLLKSLAAGTAPSVEVLSAHAEFPVVIPSHLVEFAPATSDKPTSSKPPAEVLKSYSALWKEFGDLYKSMKELRTVKWEQKIATATPKTIFTSKNKKAKTGKKKAKTTKLATAAQNFQLTASSQELSLLSGSTRQWLAHSRAAEGSVTLPALSDSWTQDMAALQSQILAIKDPFFFELLPRTEEWARFFSADADVALYPGFPLLGDPFSPPLAAVKPLGVGDLKVVKQTFQRYTAGEIAHIENVLQGEYKERKFRELNRSEEITTAEQETLEESEKDSQKTDRFELKKETENTIETDMSVQAGLTVSASYGPVSIGARADFAYSTSSRETSRSSSNFAREIVDRSVDKIQKKVREERVKKVLRETEETNLHGFENKSGSGNISGIYRWVDKHYQAQVFNYGKRLMFEFIIPEPAAFLRFNLNAGMPTGDLPPLVPLKDVTHRDIQDWNYHRYIQRYNVQGVTPPPPEYTTVATTLAAGDIPDKVARADSNKELVIPSGYVAKYWTGKTQLSVWDSGGDSGLALIVGNGNSDGSLNDEDQIVPVAVHLLNLSAYAATIEVHCERTPRHFEEWQIRTYEKISSAYRALAAERENRDAATEPMGVVISGQNPRANREIEKTELKKNCVTIMSNQYYGSFNAMSGTPPQINIPESLEEGTYIQFFEQAFEWEQVTYLFYPYFWGRKDQWANVLGGTDPDPLFDQFLKAGAARVLVPVHPLYNDAVLYYLKTGRIWNGGETPRIEDPLFLALYEELRDQQDDLDDALPIARQSEWETSDNQDEELGSRLLDDCRW